MGLGPNRFLVLGPIIACNTPAWCVGEIWRHLATICSLQFVYDNSEKPRINNTHQIHVSLHLFLTHILHPWLHFDFRWLHPLGWPHRAVLSAAVTSERRGCGILKPGCDCTDSCHAEREGGRVQRRHPRIQDRGGHTDHRSAGWDNEE